MNQVSPGPAWARSYPMQSPADTCTLCVAPLGSDSWLTQALRPEWEHTPETSLVGFQQHLLHTGRVRTFL